MHILILGAGYAGLRTALNLSKRLAWTSHQAHITLVDRNPYHQHVIMLHLAATDSSKPDDIVLPLDTILQHSAVRLLQADVQRIDPLARQVLLSDGLTLDYDRLVLALGARSCSGNVSGAAEHTWSLRTYTEALQLRDHVVDCFRAAADTSDPAERKALLTFAIVGGGFTGVQLAGELAAWAHRLCAQYDMPTSDVRVALLERSGTLLQQFGRWATGEAERALMQRGVSVHLSTEVERVEEHTMIVAGGKRLEAATIVWAAGVCAPPLLAESGLTTDHQGRVLVDRYLRGTGPDQALIFAVGDCARVPDMYDNAVPATASYAMRQGEHLADTLLAEIAGSAPRMYEPLNLGLLVSLGPGEAVGTPLGIPASGLPVALLKEAIEKWYLTTLK